MKTKDLITVCDLLEENLTEFDELQADDGKWLDVHEAFFEIGELLRKLRWIPVSERLPEEDTDVLISYRYKEGEGDTSQVHIEITSYGDMYFGGRKVEGVKHWRPPFEYFSSNYEVIAWMTLTDPYKEEQK